MELYKKFKFGYDFLGGSLLFTHFIRIGWRLRVKGHVVVGWLGTIKVGRRRGLGRRVETLDGPR